ncbi:MAG: vanadium-dependent haloperoxidase [Myxococcales bacterium]|nr:MAG: vanadium-dependent haloperoxidase [Myxococcales bacterium]
MQQTSKRTFFYDSNQSAARNWNEALLAAIRIDLARPTVHARNLFHSSAMMYDLWAIYDEVAKPFFLGNPVGGYSCSFSSDDRVKLQKSSSDIDADRAKAISYAMYRLLSHRFSNSPNTVLTQETLDSLMAAQGYDTEYYSRDYSGGDAAALGLYLANCVIEFGLQDGSNEQEGYANQYYEPVNEALNPTVSGNATLSDPNHWQPLALDTAIDQAGNPIVGQSPFLGAEWGAVVPFALRDNDCANHERDGFSYRVCHDPGPAAWLQGPDAVAEDYIWAHSLVALWSSHLDPSDGVMWDISPLSGGNTEALPTDMQDMRNFYDAEEGGVLEQWHALNPYTGLPYEAQIVPRGDYTRVLAEFWADGPASETPPGHWFTIANLAVSDHPAFERRYKGEGEVLSKLEWDVKLYFMLGGAVHDAAVSAWGIKGWYDYVRPVSAIRYMASLGQSTDPKQASYHVNGLPLIAGKIEVVGLGDELAEDQGEHVGKLKLYAWRGPNEIIDPDSDDAGVGWILDENWWPYQRPTFVTPPFAGYVSGHSAFSRAAAEVLTTITGNEFFPGGIGEFVAPKNNFLVFEEGPSMDITLQWATYRDASDQTSLSRIWGGIHPPVDDIPGRRIGIRIAQDAVELADAYFRGVAPSP